MTLPCPIIVDVTPAITPCATYKTQKGIGTHATRAQADQATIDYYANLIDLACANEIGNSVPQYTCADYKLVMGIGANATSAQATQANADYYANLIDRICAQQIIASVATSPANITAIAAPPVYLPPGTVEYVAGLNLTMGITWKNTGGTTGTYTPTLIVNGTVIPAPIPGAHTLAAGASETVMFNFVVTAPGTLAICPSQN